MTSVAERASVVNGACETWRTVWRAGFAHAISDRGLNALREALLANDPRLTQGSATNPPALECIQDWVVEGADVVAICGWLGEGLATVGEVREYWDRLCYEADVNLGEPAACRWFLNWIDETPRDTMRRELLAEVDLELVRRASSPEPVARPLPPFANVEFAPNN